MPFNLSPSRGFDTSARARFTNKACRINKHPWPWQHKRNTSVALVRGPDDQNWVRVQHHNGSQMLVPWPVFDGWDEALPPVCGIPDLELQAYAVPNIVEALQSMRRIGFAPPEVTSWPDIMKLAPVPRAGN